MWELCVLNWVKLNEWFCSIHCSGLAVPWRTGDREMLVLFLAGCCPRTMGTPPTHVTPAPVCLSIPGPHLPDFKVVHWVLFSIHLLDLPKKQYVSLLLSNYFVITVMFSSGCLRCSKPLSPVSTNGCARGWLLPMNNSWRWLTCQAQLLWHVSKWDNNSLPRHNSIFLLFANMCCFSM